MFYPYQFLESMVYRPALPIWTARSRSSIVGGVDSSSHPMMTMIRTKAVVAVVVVDGRRFRYTTTIPPAHDMFERKKRTPDGTEGAALGAKMRTLWSSMIPTPNNHLVCISYESTLSTIYLHLEWCTYNEGRSYSREKRKRGGATT